MACRKDYRDLTDAERNSFVAALHHVKAAGTVNRFASDHEDFFHDAHHSSHFLPWHREFLRRFEQALRTHDPDIAIPYWNSTVDTDPAGPLWATSFLGQFDSAWGLGRTLGSASLPPPQNVTTALGHATFGPFWPYVEGNALHNPPHNFVGGAMVRADSPHDPVFYLHHCWIDMIWAQWQLLHPGVAFEQSTAGRGLNDAMAPWATTPADVLDHRTINIYHYPAGMQRDRPTVMLETPTVTFLEVPERETRLQAAVFDLDACEPVGLAVESGPTLTAGPPTSEFRVQASPIPGDPRIDRKARLWFSFRGTAAGDAAAADVTVRCAATNEPFNIRLTANTIARPTAAAAMVLDRSNSMNFDSGIGPGITRADVLRFSAPPVVAVLEDGNAVAVCGFDHDAIPGIGMTPVAGGRVPISAAISDYTPNPQGWTAIGEGVAFARDILAAASGYLVKAMVVLTDGAENHGPHARRSIADVAELIASLNGRVFAIGLGRPEVLNPSALMALCSGNNGYMRMTGDLNADALFRLAKYYQEIFAGVTNNQIVLDPEGWILSGQEHRIPFWLNEADIEAKAVVLTPYPDALAFALETPSGNVIDAAGAAAHPMASFEIGAAIALHRVGLPIPIGADNAHAGRWQVVLKVNEDYLRYQPYTHAGPGEYLAAAGHGLHYSASIHAYSNLTMAATLAQTSNEPGATLTVGASLSEYGIPVVARARCRSELTRPDGSSATLAMPEVEPGRFEVATIAAMPGAYQFRILAEGSTLRGRPFTREQSRSGAVWRGGDTPSPHSGDDPAQAGGFLCCLAAWLGNCCRRHRAPRHYSRG